MGLFSKIKAGLKKTRDSISGSISSMLNSFTKIDEELFEELEELLVMGDVGIYTAERICDELRVRVKKQGITDPAEVMGLLKAIVADLLSGGEALQIAQKPAAILVIGVNGVGKTTTIGKLASKLKAEGNSVVLGAADTFRAAAIDQLEIWSERAGVPLVKRPEGSDPASVVFDTIAKAKSMHADVLICDTAGRLHNKKNLMDELSKMSRILDRELPDSDKEVLLVLDATTGQNAVNQAREFKNAAGITGIILTKLDGTAKGGVVLAIREELQLPVKFIGVGEKIDDLQPFDAAEFAEALFDTSSEVDENTLLRIREQNARYDAYGELLIDDETETEWVTGTEAGDAAEEAKNMMADLQEALQEVAPELLPPQPVAEPLAVPEAETEEPEAIPEPAVSGPVAEEHTEARAEEAISEEIAESEPQKQESWFERHAREKAERKAAEEAAQQAAEAEVAEVEAAEEAVPAEAEPEVIPEPTVSESAAEEHTEAKAEETIPEETAEPEPQKQESWFERRAREKAEKRARKEAERLQEQQEAERIAAAEMPEPEPEAESDLEEDGLTEAELAALESYEAEQAGEHRETREERRARKEREKAEKRARKEAEKAERRNRD